MPSQAAAVRKHVRSAFWARLAGFGPLWHLTCGFLILGCHKGEQQGDGEANGVVLLQPP